MKKINHAKPKLAPQAQWLTDAQRWKAVQHREARADGAFVFAVRSTRIYCRPSCPARRPKRENVLFFVSPGLAEQAGFRACQRCRPRDQSVFAAVAGRVCDLIERRLPDPVDLAALGAALGMSPFHLQKIFKRAMGISPREYADLRRFANFKTQIKAQPSITEAVYAAGYGSNSRAYERTGSRPGMTPDRYRQGGAGLRIYYQTVRCALGRLLVAATEKGVCAVSLGDQEEELENALRAEFPSALITRNLKKLKPWTRALQQHLSDNQPLPDVPLDLRGSAFQWRVWKSLQGIGAGTTRTYGEVARSMGEPRSVRAVARACATNPAALLIPCHRVVRGDGTLGGYRWGINRKKALLEKERRLR